MARLFACLRYAECKFWSALQPYAKAVTQAIGDVYFDAQHNKCYCQECEADRKPPALSSGAAGMASPALESDQSRLLSGQCGWSGGGKVHRFAQIQDLNPDRIVRFEQREAVHTRPLGWFRVGVVAPVFALDRKLQVRVRGFVSCPECFHACCVSLLPLCI